MKRTRKQKLRPVENEEFNLLKKARRIQRELRNKYDIQKGQNVVPRYKISKETKKSIPERKIRQDSYASLGFPTTKKSRVNYHKSYYDKLGPYTITIIFDENKTKDSAKTIVGSHTENYRKVLKREGIDIKDVLYVRLEKMKSWGAHNILVYKKSNNQQKKKYYKPHNNHYNYGKGEHRLLCIQLINDPSNIQKVEKWVYDEFLSEEWNIIPKEEYKKSKGKILYIKENNTLFESKPLNAKHKATGRKASIDLIKEAHNKERNRRLQIIKRVELVKSRKNKIKSSLKRRKVNTNKSHFDTKQQYVKRSYIDKLKYQERDELLATELVRYDDYKKYRELRNKRYVKRLNNKKLKKSVTFNTDIKEKYEKRKLKLLKYNSLRAVKKLKSKYNGTKSDK